MLGSTGPVTRRLIGALFVVAVACVDQAEKPPPPTCSGRCAGPRPGSVGHVPPGGSAGAGGESGTDEPVRLVGDVSLLVNIPALEATDFVEQVDILVEGQDGDVRGSWNALDPFSIDGVAQGAGVWAEATPLAGDALRTVQPIDTSDPNASGVVETELLVVSASEIDLALGAISVPLTPNPARAQAVLVAHRNGRPVAGVRVTAPGAEAVIYLDNGAYTDTEMATDFSGVFVLANVPPSGTYTVTLSGAVNASADLRLVSGGVTLGIVGN